MILEIIFEDEDLIAINKPHGLFVHRTKLDVDADAFVLQILRDQIGQKVFPCHRLDRKTSGVLLLAKSQFIQSLMNEQFRDRVVDKTYLAIVRGYTEDGGTIDYPLMSERGKEQEAITHYKTLSKGEIPISSGRFSTSRYSLVEVKPETGRMHQIRRHLSHIFHPIIADRPHGCNKQNRFFLQQYAMNTMMLHASVLTFDHPKTKERTTIQANWYDEFARMLRELNLLNNEYTPKS
ncbi:MAG: pseudouridylate synthase [Saprospiraceae bacterium]|nr:pseudouridylate synthase [Saprospiraceae bacterium]